MTPEEKETHDDFMALAAICKKWREKHDALQKKVDKLEKQIAELKK